MGTGFGQHFRLASSVLIVLLIAAQTAAVAHAYAHDPGALQDVACASCATASQLSAGCVDSGASHSLLPGNTRPDVQYCLPGESLRALTARQRSPPQSP